MADEKTDTQEEVVAEAVAPVVENTPAPEETPVVSEVDSTPAHEVVEEVKTPETILGEEPTKDSKEEPESDDKTVEKETEESDKEESEEKPEETQEEEKTEESQSEEPAPLPVYEDFTVPENITLDTEQVKEFTNLLSDLEINSKIDHALIQAHGQKLVDFHVAQMQKATEDLAKFYQTTWEKQKTDWKDEFLKDSEIGGKRFQTTVDSANRFIRTHGGSEEQQTEFRQLMETSGLGNHPAMIRLLASAGRAMSEGKPLAAQQPPPQPKSKVSTMYGKST